MKKSLKFYGIVWGILLILFQVIAFASAGWIGQEKYTPSFWIGYVCIDLAFVGQLACAWYAFHKCDLRKMFYNVSLVTVSYSGLIASFIFGGLCMLLSPLPYWVGILVCVAVLALHAIAVVKTAAAVELVESVDEKIQKQTFLFRSLTVDAESLMARAASDETKTACKKVYEAFRYSDPMSAPELADVESEIPSRFAAFSDAVARGDTPTVSAAAEELVNLIRTRNAKCKLFK